MIKLVKTLIAGLSIMSGIIGLLILLPLISLFILITGTILYLITLSKWSFNIELDKEEERTLKWGFLIPMIVLPVFYFSMISADYFWTLLQ